MSSQNIDSPVAFTSEVQRLTSEVQRKVLTTIDLSDIQRSSYENFLNVHLPSIIDSIKFTFENNGQHSEAKIVNYSLEFQTILEDGTERRTTPRECMERKKSYVFHLFVDLQEVKYIIHEGKRINTDSEVKEHIHFADIPIMLGTSLCVLSNMSIEEMMKTNHCHRSSKGYFIVNGLRRVLIAAERSKTNHPYIFFRKPNNVPEVEIRSSSEVVNRTTKLIMNVRPSDKEVVISIPSIPAIPVGFIFGMFGVTPETFDDLLEVPNTFEIRVMMARIKRNIGMINEDSISVLSNYVSDTIPAEKREDHFNTILFTEVVPHVGMSEKKKAYFLAFMLAKLIRAIHDPSSGQDDRDNMENKRIDGSGELLSELIRGIVAKHIKLVNTFILRQRSITLAFMKAGQITRAIQYPMTTGNWGSSHTCKKSGVSQLLSDDISFLSTLSHMRRVCPPIGINTMNVLGPRYLGPSQFGFICPVETPEGKQTGLVKNFAIGTCISIGTSRTAICDFMFDTMRDNIMFFDSDDDKDNYNFIIDSKNDSIRYPIYVNGDIIGTFLMADKDKIMTILRKARDDHNIDKEVSIAYKRVQKAIVILCDAGRVLRLVLKAKNGRLTLQDETNPSKLSFTELLDLRHIYYIDSSEDQTLLGTTIDELGNRKDATYCEISPSFALGVVAATIDFPDRNQAPRNTYQTVMAKQAMGTHSLNFNTSLGTTSYHLTYPQKRLVSTEIHKIYGLDQMSSIMIPIVAIMTHKGLNQEDALIFNKSSIERGLFQAGEIKTYTCNSILRSKDEIECITLPSVGIRKRSHYYGHLNKDGLVKKGTIVKAGHIIVGKVLKTRSRGNDGATVHKIDDISLVVRPGEEGIVSAVYVNKNVDGMIIVKVSISKLLIPEIGDKFASANAQKGVISSIIPQEDMPFTAQGITPDIIMSPMAFPSRMTIAQLVTACQGKHGCVSGQIHDSTPFVNKDPFKLIKDLKDYGFSSTGKEVMYNGITGEMLHAQIMIAPATYQRLKHIVKNKEHARSTGPISTYTRQPVSGRKNQGGLRLGEMERDALVSHGAPGLLQERLFYSSDKFYMSLCSKCNKPSGDDMCKVCGAGSRDIRRTKVPYATKLLKEELAAMGINMELIPS